MPKPLVIVESPAKAKTIAGYLGADYVVESSIGHIRDLPRRPPTFRPRSSPSRGPGSGWTSTTTSSPLRRSREKREQVAKLRRLVAAASEVDLATDEDREGESIAWHLAEVLSPRVPVMRMVFHEITPAAIRAGVDIPLSSTGAWSTLRRRGVSSTASTATRSRPSFGARSQRGSPPAGFRASPPGSSWSASASRCGSAPPAGAASRAASPPRPSRSRRLVRSAEPRSRPARTSADRLAQRPGCGRPLGRTRHQWPRRSA